MGTEEAAQGLDAGSIPGEGERGPWGLGLPVIWEGAISGHLCLHRSHLRGRAGPLRRRPLQERRRVPGVGGLRELLLRLPARLARWALLRGRCLAAAGARGKALIPGGVQQHLRLRVPDPLCPQVRRARSTSTSA